MTSRYWEKFFQPQLLYYICAKLPPIKDEALIALLQQEPEKGMERIFRTYYTSMCAVVYKILPQANAVEDIVQEVLLAFWKKRDHLEVTTNLGAYLRRAARNRTLNYIRDRRLMSSTDEELSLAASDSYNSDMGIELSETQERIDAAINTLPERCRLVFVLSRFEEMTYPEIAGELNISVKTVEHQISKALRLLRERLK